MKKRKKLQAAAMAFLMVLCMCGCNLGSGLSEEFEEAEVKEQAKEVVSLMNAADYAAVTALVREDLQAALSPEVLAGAADTALQKLGEFESFQAVAAVGQPDAETKEPLAVVLVRANYENGSATFTVSFDTQLRVVGLWIQ